MDRSVTRQPVPKGMSLPASNLLTTAAERGRCITPCAMVVEGTFSKPGTGKVVIRRATDQGVSAGAAKTVRMPG